jgi:hypothetical protein
VCDLSQRTPEKLKASTGSNAVSNSQCTIVAGVEEEAGVNDETDPSAGVGHR